VEVTTSASAFRQACERARAEGRSVALVPTMGALHEGHASLLRAARSAGDVVAMSIFVNPLQFTSAEDLAAYPRTLERDLEMAAACGVDLAFTPDEAEVYPAGPPSITVDPGPLGERLEGASRPGHFRGVLRIVAVLFHLAGRSRALFGQKDAQQLELIRRMVRDLRFDVEVLGCPTVREADGLALSSRNVRLTPDQRQAAPVLFEALSDAAVAVRSGERDAAALKAEMARTIGSAPGARLDYVALVDDRSWDEVDRVEGSVRALVACGFGPVRLIDNLLLPAVAERAK
jgi:pantoate--beta-alanine ligase